MENNRPSSQLLSLLAILVFLAFVTAVNFVGQRNIKRQQLCVSMHQSIERDFRSAVDPKLQAHAASVFNFSRNQNIYSLNDTAALPLASLTKLMTVRVALASVKMQDMYTVQASDIMYDGVTWFVPGDTYSIRDIVAATLIASSNNAANMLARATGLSGSEFIARMNAEAAALGLSTLQYESVSGLDTPDLKPKAVGSAHDVLALLAKNTIDMPEVMAIGTLPKETIRATNGRSIELENTDDIVKNIELLKASKTGYTVTAGGNLAVLWQTPRGEVLGAAVLGSTISGRFTDILILHDAANLYTEALRALPAYCSQ